MLQNLRKKWFATKPLVSTSQYPSCSKMQRVTFATHLPSRFHPNDVQMQNLSPSLLSLSKCHYRCFHHLPSHRQNPCDRSQDHHNQYNSHKRHHSPPADTPPPPSSPSPSSLDSPSYRETKCTCASVRLLSITGQQATWVRQAHLSRAVTLPLTNWSAKGAHLRAGAVGGALYGRRGLAGGEGLRLERAYGRRGLAGGES